MERKELIKITTKGENQTVSARELYEGLGYDLKQGNFNRWIENQLFNVDAVENVDFTRFVFKDVGNNADIFDYEITVEIAKEICMVVGASPRANKEVKAKSKEIRKYFIECERIAKQKQVPRLTEEEKLALQVYHGGISAIEASQKLVELKTAELKPKADYYDKVLTADNCRSITEIAKDYGLSGRKLNQILNDKGVQYKTPSGQWVLYSKYDGHGYVKTQSTILYDGEVKYYTKWTAKGQKFIDDLLKK